MDLTDVFGVNVKKMFEEWFRVRYANIPSLYEGRRGFTLVILDPTRTMQALIDWSTPLDYAMLTCFAGQPEDSTGPGGTLMNVERKLRFVLRQFESSARAEAGDESTLVYLLQPGDFPWEGAGEYRDFFGGVSGLDKHDDWKVFCECVDKLIELLTPVCKAALARADEHSKDALQPITVKYLEGVDVSDLFPDYAAAA